QASHANFPIHDSQRNQREISRNELQPKENDHDKTDRKDQRADNTETSLSRSGQSQGRCKAQQRSGKDAADQKIFSAKLSLIGSGLNHRVYYKIGFYVIHSTISLSRFFCRSIVNSSPSPLTAKVFAFKLGLLTQTPVLRLN